MKESGIGRENGLEAFEACALNPHDVRTTLRSPSQTRRASLR